MRKGTSLTVEPKLFVNILLVVFWIPTKKVDHRVHPAPSVPPAQHFDVILQLIIHPRGGMQQIRDLQFDNLFACRYSNTVEVSVVTAHTTDHISIAMEDAQRWITASRHRRA